MVNTDRILPSLQPDVILFDNRLSVSLLAVMTFSDTWKHKKSLLFCYLMHHITLSNGEFCRFNKMNDCLMPEYTEHWMLFKMGALGKWRRGINISLKNWLSWI